MCSTGWEVRSKEGNCLRRDDGSEEKDDGGDERGGHGE